MRHLKRGLLKDYPVGIPPVSSTDDCGLARNGRSEGFGEGSVVAIRSFFMGRFLHVVLT